ncbi:hypothetical protein B5S31_g3370 [[Candida] boidinii]|nr:hypothetical protein B5S31_g3370 [[Candida] boidinii]
MKLNSDKASFMNSVKNISGQSVKKLEALFGIDECQKVLNNQMANINHEFSELVKFATLLKLDKDPPNSVGSQNDNQLKKNRYQEYYLTWLELSYFDKLMALMLVRKPLLDIDDYNDKFTKFIQEDPTFGTTSEEEKMRLNILIKRNKAHKFVFKPMLLLKSKAERFGSEIKFKEYLKNINSLDNFIEFDNDYNIDEIFEFIDIFETKYPIFFKNPTELSAHDETHYLMIHNKSTNKSYEINYSLFWIISSMGIQFSMYYSLFRYFDNSVDYINGF